MQRFFICGDSASTAILEAIWRLRRLRRFGVHGDSVVAVIHRPLRFGGHGDLAATTIWRPPPFGKLNNLVEGGFSFGGDNAKAW